LLCLLQFEFGECDKDLNSDGVVNATDTALIPLISTWRQETASAPWVKVGSTVEVEINEVQAENIARTIMHRRWRATRHS